jgi:hypothetical protein
MGAAVGYKGGNDHPMESGEPTTPNGFIVLTAEPDSRLIRLGCDPMLMSIFRVRFDEGIDHADRADRCRYQRQR